MKITIVCANGRAGKLILEEAVNRGHEVTAIVRNNRDLPDTVNIIEKIYLISHSMMSNQVM